MKLTPTNETTRRSQWVGFVTSPAAWTVYFVVVYVLNEAACKVALMPATAVFPLSSLFTLLTLALLAYAGWLAYRAWRYGDGGGNGRFLGITGLIMCGLFTLMTTAVWIATWVLMPC